MNNKICDLVKKEQCEESKIETSMLQNSSIVSCENLKKNCSVETSKSQYQQREEENRLLDYYIKCLYRKEYMYELWQNDECEYEEFERESELVPDDELLREKIWARMEEIEAERETRDALSLKMEEEREAKKALARYPVSKIDVIAIISSEYLESWWNVIKKAIYFLIGSISKGR